MKKHFKVAAIGALAALGLASAAVAEQSNTKAPANGPMNHQMMGQQGTMGNGQMMMNDPKMRQHMTEMMESCSKMMKHMSSMSDMQHKPKT